MLTKFESKSSRVKGLAFHPRRPWILASLHSGSIQWWDYRMGTLLERFDEHEGPVRGVAFHSSQPLFVSGGDDYKVRVWNHKLRRRLFVLHGHMDYIRSVSFHHEEAWILSCSDDQTIRIWNWQNRTCLSIITGHSHYVMCAQFHPRDDLMVTGSLDFTVRVWDISGLRKKHSARSRIIIGGGITLTSNNNNNNINNDDSRFINKNTTIIGGGNNNNNDIFANNDFRVKFILEGHDKGINWVSFHPTQPLIISAGDDRQIKLWRMTDSKAWEVDTFRGHFNNVSCAVFHPHLDLVLSNSEDKTIRVWDLARRVAASTFRREHDRMWMLVAHPNINLFAAGHDSGMIVFKLERERPAFTICSPLKKSNELSSIVYISGKSVLYYEISNNEISNTNNDPPRVLGQILRQNIINSYPRSISFLTKENLLLVTLPRNELNTSTIVNSTSTTIINSSSGNGGLELYKLNLQEEPINIPAFAGCFISRNRIAAIEKIGKSILIFDSNGLKLKSIQVINNNNKIENTNCCNNESNIITEIFSAGLDKVIIISLTSVEIWDINLGIIKGILENVNGIKYIVWSEDMKIVALLSKHMIYLCEGETLLQKSIVHETIRIKSAVFDKKVLIYTTLNHIKFTLCNGDNGIISTLENPIYLVKVNKGIVTALNRDHIVKTFKIDSTEYRFKVALIEYDYKTVLNIIENSTLVGQSIIAYLQKTGYSEVALHFVQDFNTRLDLSLECGRLDIALESINQINLKKENNLIKNWKRISKEAINQGNIKLTEQCLQEINDFGGLSLLYLITGNEEKQKKLLNLTEEKLDFMSSMMSSIYLGDISARARILEKSGQLGLAYLTCITHGLYEQSSEIILKQKKIIKKNIKELLKEEECYLIIPKKPLLNITENWPRKDLKISYFEKEEI